MKGLGVNQRAGQPGREGIHEFSFNRRLAELGGGEHSNALEFVMLGLLWASVELNWLWTTLVRH